MKNSNAIILGFALIATSIYLLTRGSMGKVSDLFLIVASVSAFLLNASIGVRAIKKKEWKSFLVYSGLPFALIYMVAVVLYILASLEASPESPSLKLAHLWHPYGHKKSLGIFLAYLVGGATGFLFRSKKALKISAVSILVIGVVGFVYFFVGPTKNGLSGDSDSSYDFIEGKFMSVEELVALPQFKDKKVYLDLWFSSCGPCIQEFRDYLPQLKEKLHDSGIEYLYLARETSHPNSKTMWLRAIKKYKLEGWHYYIPKSDESSIWKSIMENAKLDNQGYYPYNLIAVNGRITNYKASLPSELENILNEINIE